MIKVNEETFEADGYAYEILSDLAIAILNVRQAIAEVTGEELAAKLVRKAICLSNMTEEELSAEEKKQAAALDGLEELLRQAGGMEKEEKNGIF